MSGDVVVFVAALIGLIAKRLWTPPRWRWSVHDAIEVVAGAILMIPLYALVPRAVVPETLTTNELRHGASIFAMAFFLGPGIITIAKTLLWERLPHTVRGMLPPPNGEAKPP